MELAWKHFFKKPVYLKKQKQILFPDIGCS